MSKPILLAIGGAVAGVAVAFGAFVFLLGDGDTVVADDIPPSVVNVPGKLGPHIVLSDRVFNLASVPGESSVYLKLQTVIEFETTDQRWERVLNGCGAVRPHGAAFEVAPDMLVSAVPGGVPPLAVLPAAPSGGDPCEAEHEALLAEFERRIGTGRQLIEDAVTTIVTGHTAAEISTPAGKELLKAEIREAVDALIYSPQVVRVLFVNFITQ